MKKITCVVLFSSLLAGCASPTKHVVQTYVPVSMYSSYSCRALAAEMRRIVRKQTELAGVQDETARADSIKTGFMGLGLLTAGLGAAVTASTDAAALITATGLGTGTVSGALIHGNDANTNQIALLKGELDAAERSFIQRGC
jgi:hypothetical protein